MHAAGRVLDSIDAVNFARHGPLGYVEQPGEAPSEEVGEELDTQTIQAQALVRWVPEFGPDEYRTAARKYIHPYYRHLKVA